MIASARACHGDLRRKGEARGVVGQVCMAKRDQTGGLIEWSDLLASLRHLRGTFAPRAWRPHLSSSVSVRVRGCVRARVCALRPLRNRGSTSTTGGTCQMDVARRTTRVRSCSMPPLRSYGTCGSVACPALGRDRGRRRRAGDQQAASAGQRLPDHTGSPASAPELTRRLPRRDSLM